MYLLIVDGSYFPYVIDHARTTERSCIEVYGCGGRRQYQQFSIGGILFVCRNPLSRGQLYLHLINSIKVTSTSRAGS